MTLEEKVTSIIVEQLDVTKEECVPEASFIDDLGADSLDLVELIMEMEETFDIQIADNELSRSVRSRMFWITFGTRASHGMSSLRQAQTS